jgi:hypothetical protein
MKIRSGFVSNSSSSSFIAIGIGKKWGKPNTKFNDILKALLGCAPEDITYEVLERYWYEYGQCKKDGISFYTSDTEPFFIGMDLIEGIKKDKKLSELKKELKVLVKDKLNITLPLKEIELRVGETHSG